MLKEMGHCGAALSRLALEGPLRTGFQNRFPLTWSDVRPRSKSIDRRRTVSDESPEQCIHGGRCPGFSDDDWATLASGSGMESQDSNRNCWNVRSEIGPTADVDCRGTFGLQNN